MYEEVTVHLQTTDIKIINTHKDWTYPSDWLICLEPS